MKKASEEYSILYDYYGQLLSLRQREVFELYYEENLSLSEIAENIGVSRQAVHITLAKANCELEGFEERLELIRKSTACEKILEEASMKIDAILKDKERMAGINAETAKDLRRIKKLIKELEV